MRATRGLAASGAVATAFAVQAQGALATDFLNAQQIESSLAVFAQISPAAREGAEAYLATHQLHCGGPMSAAQLQVAAAQGQGDAWLLAFIRAAQQGDRDRTRQLVLSYRCPLGATH
ncbi:MAG TPA: hypothetical protein PK177_10165 [Burkholderiaceae bacterium]|nr:hypothetical protein [Burkholderiaceae bacterium]